MIEPGRPHRSRRALPLGSQELLAGQLFQPWPHEPGTPIPISLRDWATARPPTELFLEPGLFSAHCELAGTVADDGRVMADVRPDGLFFIAAGWTDDFNELDRRRAGREQLTLDHALLVCRLLATGVDQTATSEFNGRPFKSEWTLVDRRVMPAEARSPAEQPVWFHPGGSDYAVLRIQSAGLIRALGAEVSWVLRHVDRPERSQLAAMLVLLDQAMIRCGM